jgi:26S proteasome regulatory subunit N12
VSVY